LRATSRFLGSPRGSPRSREEDAPRRLLQPTHDTSTRGSRDSRARRLAPRRPPPPDRAGARGRLRRQPASRRPGPRWSALDGAVPASVHFDHSRSAPLPEWSRGLPLDGGSHLAAALSTACQAGERPLTLSVAPRALPGRDDLTSPRGTEDRFPRFPVKGSGFVGPERLPSTGAPKEPRFRATVLVGARHRCLGFATEDPASGAPSPPRCSRPERLDPTSAPGVLHPWTRWAKRRLSTSAIYCDPRAHPTVRPNPAHRARGRPRAQLFFEPPSFDGGADCGWPRFSGRSLSRCHGPGAGSRDCLVRAVAPPAAIARGGSFSPTRSARTPPVAGSWRRRLE
jgi:hypothetical protein